MDQELNASRFLKSPN